jgi:IS4 transposase
VHCRKKRKAKVQRDEVVELTYHPEDERNRYYEFLTNSFEITAEEVAFHYKKRRGLEFLFKKMKQNFQLHYFYGESDNAIRTQVWCTLIAQLLMTVIQKMTQTKMHFPLWHH